MKIIYIILLVIVSLIVLSVLGVAFKLITIPWLTFSSKVEMNRDIIKQVYDSDNALYNYHWFKQQSEDIKATKLNIDQANQQIISFEQLLGEHSTWTFDDKQEDSRLRAVYLGLKNQYNNLVAEYNARAQQVDRAIFKDELPLFFNLEQ